MISGIVFDLGHTLMGQDEEWGTITKQSAADLDRFLHEQGVKGKNGSIVNTFLELKEQYFHQSLADHREIPALQSLREAFNEHGLDGYSAAFYREALDVFFRYERTKWYPYANAKSVLKELRDRGLALGIFSNASDDAFIQQLVDDFGFRPYVDPVLTSPGTGVCKPDVMAFRPFLEAWSLPAKSVVMVGDRLEADITGGKNAGMKTILFQLDKEALAKRDIYADELSGKQVRPDAVISDLSELQECLASLG